MSGTYVNEHLVHDRALAADEVPHAPDPAGVVEQTLEDRPGVISTDNAGDNAVSSRTALAVEPQVRSLARARELRHCPYLERIQGVLDGVPGGALWDPRDPLS